MIRLPWAITAAWVQTCSISSSRCEDRKTVVPSERQLPHQGADLAHALGVEAVGRLVQHEQVAWGCSSAAARPSRCFMPSE